MSPTDTNMKSITAAPAGLILTLAAALSTGFAADPPAVSAAFTSRDPVVVSAMDLVKAGSFQKAEDLLRAADQAGDPEALRARQEALEIIRRTRFEYSLDEAGLLAKVRRSVPDATAQDVQRWAKNSCRPLPHD